MTDGRTSRAPSRPTSPRVAQCPSTAVSFRAVALPRHTAPRRGPRRPSSSRREQRGGTAATAELRDPARLLRRDRLAELAEGLPRG